MPNFTDQLNRTITTVKSPMKIVSLVPSQTELLFDLGLGDRVIGITKFCIYPAIWFKKKKRVGGTKDFNLEIIRSLNPDLIIGNKEENTEEGLKGLMKDFPVWISDIKNLGDALEMINEVGKITDTEYKAKEIISEIETNFKSLITFTKRYPFSKKRVAYLIWQNPIISIGTHTFIADMLLRCDLLPVFSEHNRYPEIPLNELMEHKIDYLFLSSEPFPFKEKHRLEFEAQFPEIKVILVDGEYFSWYGSRLIKSPTYFRALLSSLKD